MTIITNCPDCDRPILRGLSAGRFAPTNCEDCGCRFVIEMTRADGYTYTEDHFVTEILPGLDDVERIDHPEKDVYVYGDPDVTKAK